jgi:hypothetical protein
VTGNRARLPLWWDGKQPTTPGGRQKPPGRLLFFDDQRATSTIADDDQCRAGRIASTDFHSCNLRCPPAGGEAAIKMEQTVTSRELANGAAARKLPE